jgi:hypothetical protein
MARRIKSLSESEKKFIKGHTTRYFNSDRTTNIFEDMMRKRDDADEKIPQRMKTTKEIQCDVCQCDKPEIYEFDYKTDENHILCESCVFSYIHYLEDNPTFEELQEKNEELEKRNFELQKEKSKYYPIILDHLKAVGEVLKEISSNDEEND